MVLRAAHSVLNWIPAFAGMMVRFEIALLQDAANRYDHRYLGAGSSTNVYFVTPGNNGVGRPCTQSP